MTAQQINYSNFFETTLDGNVGASDTNLTLSAAPTTNGTNAIEAPFYLVINPDNAKREVILVTAFSGVTMSTVERDKEGRHSPDIGHTDGDIVRMAVVGEMFEDLHDQLTSGTLELTNKTLTSPVLNTGVSGTAVLDEDTLSSNSATKLATQQSIKAYVDSGATTMANKILKDYAETENALGTTSGTTLSINLALGNCATVTLAHNIDDIDFTNVPTDFATLTLVVTQDGTGSRTMDIDEITVNADAHQTAKTAGGAGLTLSTAASAVDILTFLFVDETPYLFSQLAFA